MIAEGATYRTELLKVSGIVSETIALLGAWEPGMKAEELVAVAVERDLLSKATASRVKDVVYKGFANRFLRPDDRAASLLRELLEHHVDLDVLKQLFFLYASRSQSILSDFVTEVYWPRVNAGLRELPLEESERFILGSFGSDRLPGRWAPSLVKKMKSNLLKTLADFGLLGPLHRSSREILPFALSPFAFRFIVHEMHFGGAGDTTIVESPDWRLFGLQKDEVVNLLRRDASSTGSFIFQYSGNLARFSWVAESMEDYIRANA